MARVSDLEVSTSRMHVGDSLGVGSFGAVYVAHVNDLAGGAQLALKQVIQLPKPLWREVMELCGGELRQTSKRSYGEEET